MSPQHPDRIVVVTDSTAYLPDALVDAHRIHVVPMHVIVDGEPGQEGVDFTPADVSRALRDRRGRVTTSRPSPEEFSTAYATLLDNGASGVVSVHVSGALSGTLEAAQLAADGCAGRVAVVDSQSTGMGLGFPVLAAAEAAAGKAGLEEVQLAAEEAIGRTSIFFYVDTLEFLRRGGRISAGEALLGTALAVKPILHVDDGQVLVKEKVRTAGRALARIEELAVETAGDGAVDLAVHHLDSLQRAEELVDQLRKRLPGLKQAHISEVGAAVGAHVGHGLVAAVVHRHE
ncbi:MAG: DegV family protein [Micromonosporaceae bacterium]